MQAVEDPLDVADRYEIKGGGAGESEGGIGEHRGVAHHGDLWSAFFKARTRFRRVTRQAPAHAPLGTCDVLNAQSRNNANRITIGELPLQGWVPESSRLMVHS